jgi:threonine dehydrogenase-like Zn-dependent dehydrogenase
LSDDAARACGQGDGAFSGWEVLAIAGDFFGYANHIPVGALMEKCLMVRAGQVHVQRYWDLLGRIERGEFDPTFVISHRMPLEQAAEAYRIFDQKADNALKIVLST